MLKQFSKFQEWKSNVLSFFLLEGQMLQVSPWVTVTMTRVVRAKLCCDVITMMVVEMMIIGNSDVGNDFHCGSYDIVLMFGTIWDDIKVTVKRCCTVVSVAGGQTTSSCLGQGCDIYPQVRSNI